MDLERQRLFEAKIPLNTVLRMGETELLFEPASQGQQEPSFHGLVGNDPAMRQRVKLIQRVAPSNAVVTILGESGTGKELVARALFGNVGGFGAREVPTFPNSPARGSTPGRCSKLTLWTRTPASLLLLNTFSVQVQDRLLWRRCGRR